MKRRPEFRDELPDFQHLFLFRAKKRAQTRHLIVTKRIGVRVTKEPGRDYRKSD